VNPRVFLIALVVGAVVLGGGWWLIRDSRRSEGVAEAPAAPTAVNPVTPKAIPKPEPERETSRRAREVAPKDTEASAAKPTVPAAPTKGTLHVTSDVPEALVFLDRTYAGKAPVTIQNILLGPHKVNVSAEGFEGASQDVDIVAGPQDVEVRLREVRLKAAIAVVHKHRAGSCTGTLIASPQGIRFDTPNQEDAFSAALTDMEQFEVDYLKKNLLVKLRGGKTYNFTDPGGNADKLFVFQRDVEKARARLAKGDAPAS
jgi:hypothetical protein